MSKRCIIIKSNASNRDIRVPKEVDALNKKYKVMLLGWNRNKEDLNSGRKNLKNEEKLMNVRAPYGKRILLFLPVWWIFVFFWLIVKRWDVAQAINLDSAVPTIIASKIKRKKVIYEILDTYEDGIKLPLIIRNILLYFDKILLMLSDAVILVDDAQFKEFNGISNKNIITMYDSPPVIDIHLSVRDTNRDEFIIFYAGVLYRDRHLNLEKMVDAIRNIDNVKMIIAGYGDLESDIRAYESLMPNKIKFIGKISYEDAIKNCIASDLLFVLRDPIVPINKYICGSTLLNAMMCGKPILVNKGGSTADKVINENCGLIVDANKVEDITDAIIKLRDNPELYKKFEMNARNAYEHRYNWNIMEKRLLELYKFLIDG